MLTTPPASPLLENTQRLSYFGETVTDSDYPALKKEAGKSQPFFAGYSVQVLTPAKNATEDNDQKEMLCSLCNGLMRKPSQTPCGHRSCKHCLHHHLYIRQATLDKTKAVKCPACIRENSLDGDSVITIDRITPDFFSKRKQSRKVHISRCPVGNNSDQPCLWTGGTLLDLYGHETTAHNNIEATGDLWEHYNPKPKSLPAEMEAAAPDSGQSANKEIPAGAIKKKKKKKKKKKPVDTSKVSPSLPSTIRKEPVTREFSLKLLKCASSFENSSNNKKVEGIQFSDHFDISDLFQAKVGVEFVALGSKKIFHKLNVHFQLSRGPESVDAWPLRCHLTIKVLLGKMEKSVAVECNDQLAEKHPESFKIMGAGKGPYRSLEFTKLRFNLNELKEVQDRKTGLTDAKLKVECSFSEPEKV